MLYTLPVQPILLLKNAVGTKTALPTAYCAAVPAWQLYKLTVLTVPHLADGIRHLVLWWVVYGDERMTAQAAC